MEGFDRITIEPGKMGCQSCIRGRRFTVEHLLTLVGGEPARDSRPARGAQAAMSKPSMQVPLAACHDAGVTEHALISLSATARS